MGVVNFTFWLLRPQQKQSLPPNIQWIHEWGNCDLITGKVKRFLFFSRTSQPILMPTQPLSQWVQEALSPSIQKPRCEPHHTPLPNDEVKNQQSSTSIPSYAFMASQGQLYLYHYVHIHCFLLKMCILNKYWNQWHFSSFNVIWMWWVLLTLGEGASEQPQYLSNLDMMNHYYFQPGSDIL